MKEKYPIKIAWSLVKLRTEFGMMGIAWKETDSPVVERILLPGEKMRYRTGFTIREIGPKSLPPFIQDLSRKIYRFLSGYDTAFELDCFHLKQCSSFQQKVLIAEFNIPRGSVSTYGRIAAHLGIPGGARAVGNALGANPFPIVIPCHRAIRSDGSVGGYRGGAGMKRKLLEREGLRFKRSGKVIMDGIFY